ncbi:hypothetical protein GF367_03445 [Candidatus Woesearchaeota archaeon]|nr:hypothetical protein [Candidatus Woesearchaeota archaeon]
MELPLYLDGPKDEFLISSVRKADNDLLRRFREYKERRAKEGVVVHLPHDDTVQEDPIGLYVCIQNKNALQDASRVSMFLDPTSSGSVVDFGMTFMAGKTLTIVDIVNGERMDDFSEFIKDYADGTNGLSDRALSNPFYGELQTFKERVTYASEVHFPFDDDKLGLAKFGMVFMSGKPFVLENVADVSLTDVKSYQNVARALHDLYR